MNEPNSLQFDLHDGTHVTVFEREPDCFEFHMTRLNSEKHNFVWKNGKIEESDETRFDAWQNEAVATFEARHRTGNTDI